MAHTDQSRSVIYSKAAAHSARVRLIKIALPVMTLAAVVGLFGFLALSRVSIPNVDVDIAASTIQNGKLVMANPRMTGFTDDERPYTVIARKAVQAVDGTGSVELEALRASITLDDGREADLSARIGVFDNNANMLELTENAVLEMSDGLTAHLENASIDMNAGSVTTDRPVRIEQPGTLITADRMQIKENGKQLVFESRVRVTMSGQATANMTPGDAGTAPTTSQ